MRLCQHAFLIHTFHPPPPTTHHPPHPHHRQQHVDSGRAHQHSCITSATAVPRSGTLRREDTSSDDSGGGSDDAGADDSGRSWHTDTGSDLEEGGKGEGVVVKSEEEGTATDMPARPPPRPAPSQGGAGTGRIRDRKKKGTAATDTPARPPRQTPSQGGAGAGCIRDLGRARMVMIKDLQADFVA